MRIGIGLPSVIPAVAGQLIVEWAHAADEGPFSSLGVFDRLIYDSYDPLISLAAAAAVTRRVRLATSIIIGPLRDTAMLAKEAASLDAISGGRLVLGLAVGARQNDYTAAGVDYNTRGRRFSEQLGALRSLWEDATLSPPTARRSGPELLVGGLNDPSFARMTRYADGYIHGGGPPKAFARAADKARAAWSDSGRIGRPLLWAHGYFALGDESTIEAGARTLKDYYAFTGPFAEKVAAGMLTSPQAVAQFVRGYEEAGCDELILFPTVADLTQLVALATILKDLGRQPEQTVIDQQREVSR